MHYTQTFRFGCGQRVEQLVWPCIGGVIERGGWSKIRYLTVDYVKWTFLEASGYLKKLMELNDLIVVLNKFPAEVPCHEKEKLTRQKLILHGSKRGMWRNSIGPRSFKIVGGCWGPMPGDWSLVRMRDNARMVSSLASKFCRWL